MTVKDQVSFPGDLKGAIDSGLFFTTFQTATGAGRIDFKEDTTFQLAAAELNAAQLAVAELNAALLIGRRSRSHHYFHEIMNLFPHTDFPKVFEFMKKTRFSEQLILDAYQAITQEFTNPVVSLDLIEVPESRRHDYLVISILTDLSVEEANEKLSRINENWTYPHYPELGGKLHIYLDYL